MDIGSFELGEFRKEDLKLVGLVLGGFEEGFPTLIMTLKLL